VGKLNKTPSYCYERICTECGVLFWSNKVLSKFCSTECRWTNERTKNKESLPLCKQCGNPTKRHKSLFCSPECQAKYKRLPSIFCDQCNNKITNWRDRSRDNHFCSIECANIFQVKHRCITSLGYILVNAPNKYPGTNHGRHGQKKALEHHLVWWKYYGYLPPTGWDIHHIDLDKSNNNIYNLVLIEKKLHQLLHRQLRTIKEAKLCFSSSTVKALDLQKGP
jgi:hypothetical protein